MQILNTIVHKAPWLMVAALLIALWWTARATVERTGRLRNRIRIGKASAEDFSGLTLPLIAIAFLFGLFLAGDLLPGLREGSGLQAFDDMVNRRIDPLRTKRAVLFFTGLTTLGGTWTLSILVLAASGFLWLLKKREHVLPLWLTVLGTMSTTFLGKGIIDRARPEFLAGITADSPSFPSGHAAGAMAVYGFFAYLAARELSGPRARFEAVYWSMTLVFLIGFSRIFLSVHYFSDVLVGWIVGFLWILAGAAADQWISRGTAQTP
ncbi:MAG TPA: phosphatase PAP2 family protein [Syntrophales bacterium]|nr:phosphatase PAP2 family protein [Syntrophales bacterium]